MTAHPEDGGPDKGDAVRSNSRHRLDDIQNEVRTALEQLGRQPVADLGFLLSEVLENQGAHLERAQRELASSPLLQGLTGYDVASRVALAIGADAARVASQSGALADAVLEGAEPDEIADLAAESIGFAAFLEQRMARAQQTLEAAGVLMAAAASDDDRRRVELLGEQSYALFVAAHVDEELGG